MADPSFYQSGGDEIAAKTAQLNDLESSLETAYARWEELDS